MTRSGFDSLGAFWDTAGDVLKAGAAVAEGQIEAHQAGIEQAQTASEEHSRFEAAKTADAQAAAAIAHAIVTSALGTKTAESDRAFAEKMFADATTAHDKLAPDSERLRQTFARAQLAQAQARSMAAPADGYRRAFAEAWQKVVSQVTPFGEKQSASTTEPWLTRRVWGPVPGVGVLALGGGLLAGVGYVVIRFLGK